MTGAGGGLLFGFFYYFTIWTGSVFLISAELCYCRLSIVPSTFPSL